MSSGRPDNVGDLHDEIARWLRDQQAAEDPSREVLPGVEAWITDRSQDWEAFFDGDCSDEDYARRASDLLWIANLSDAAAGWKTDEFYQIRVCLWRADDALRAWRISQHDDADANQDLSADEGDELGSVGNIEDIPPLLRARFLVSLALLKLGELHERAISHHDAK